MRVVVLTVLAACSFQRGSFGSSGTDDGGMDALRDGAVDAVTSPLRQKTITIASTIAGTHVGFPLWFTVADSDLRTRALQDGSDIHFVASDGTALPFEIQHWNKSDGRLDAWVRVPSLDAGTQLAIRYGDATAAHAADPAATFAGYAAVWHFEDDLTTTTIVDATGARNGTAVQLGTTDTVPAKLGRGIDFRNDNEEITFTNPLSGSTPHTISVWIDQGTTTTNDAIIAMGNGNQDQARWFHSRFNASTIAVGFYANDYPNPAHDVINDGLVLLHWVFEGSSRNSLLYADGVQVGVTHKHGSGINTQGTAGTIGNAPSAFGSSMGINATLDELRIIDVARTPEWIAAEALNQAMPSAFYSLGPEQIP